MPAMGNPCFFFLDWAPEIWWWYTFRGPTLIIKGTEKVVKCRIFAGKSQTVTTFTYETCTMVRRKNSPNKNISAHKYFRVVLIEQNVRKIRFYLGHCKTLVLFIFLTMSLWMYLCAFTHSACTTQPRSKVMDCCSDTLLQNFSMKFRLNLSRSQIMMVPPHNLFCPPDTTFITFIRKLHFYLICMSPECYRTVNFFSHTGH